MIDIDGTSILFVSLGASLGIYAGFYLTHLRLFVVGTTYHKLESRLLVLLYSFLAPNNFHWTFIALIIYPLDLSYYISRHYDIICITLPPLNQ